MTSHGINMIRAAFLLIVFSLNTIAGFACSIGLDLGYNVSHHKHGDLPHENCSNCHKHDKSKITYTSPGIMISEPNDDCCANQVNSFARLDKSIVQNNLLLKSPGLYISIVSQLPHDINVRTYGSVKSWCRFVRRSRTLDDTDIRIAIQSFQV